MKALTASPNLPFGLAADLRALAHPAVVPAGQASTGGPFFPVSTYHLHPGDSLVFSTDGVTDARTPGGDFFGQERLVALLQAVEPPGESPVPAAELMRRVVHALLEHQQSRLTDDATLMLVQYRHATQ